MLRQHKLRLNAKKCAFGVGAGKFHMLGDIDRILRIEAWFLADGNYPPKCHIRKEACLTAQSKSPS